MGIKHFLKAFFTVLALGALVAPAAFDPVNDDTDIFLANPTIAAERPNVLLIVDNSANWNKPFANEKNALVQVINGLTDQYNVGLMIMSDSNIKRSGPGGSDGGYVRYHVRQMTSQNKTALATVINNFDQSSDKGDNAIPGLALYEAYLYFSGKNSRAGDDQSKVDHDGTTDPLLTPLTEHALPWTSGSFPNENSLYRSPIKDGCQRNFVIYISNGPANENATARAALEGYLGTLTGVSPPSQITITPAGQQGNWMDELARFVANADVFATSASVPNSTGVQNIYTYTVEIDPEAGANVINVRTTAAHNFAVNDTVVIAGTTNYNGNFKVNAIQSTTQFSIVHSISPNPATEAAGTATVGASAFNIAEISQTSSDMTALLKSVAANGKGKYFGVSSDASGAGIVDALNSIFTEVQAVNSVFASTTLPVSVNVRGTNLNQVYIGVFRPDATKSPRWLGNLKMYNLALNSATGTVFLADAANGIPPAVGNAAQNSSTGFVSQTSPSFWTTNSAFWGFRTPDQNGPGGASDKPDGDLVEKGGAAQQLRLAFPLTQTARNLYTCTTGNVGVTLQTCASGSLLSNTPFVTTNEAITAGSLQLDTRLVSPLTAFETKTVSSLTDRSNVTLSNANPLTSVNVSTLSNGGTTRTITSLTTATPQAISSISGLQQGNNFTVPIVSVDKVSGKYVVTTSAALSGVVIDTSTITFSCGAGGDAASFSGLTTAERTIRATGTSGANFTYTVNGPGGGTKTCNTPGTITGPGPEAGPIVTVTMAGPHGFISGQTITIAGTNPTSFQGSFGITCSPAPNCAGATTFTYVPGGSHGAGQANTGTAAGNTTTATATFAAAHGFAHGSSVLITGASIAAYNGTKTISCTANDCTGKSQFTYSVGATAIAPNTASPVYAVQGGTTTVTVTTAAPHGFGDLESIVISGSDIAGYNGTFLIDCPACVSGVPSQTTFSYTVSSVLPANTSTSVTASSSTGTLSTVTATATNHGFVAGNSVTIESTSGDTVHPGTYTVLAVPAPTANTFAYTTFAADGTTPQSRVAPSGGYTVRPAVSHRAIATVANHGFGVAGATKEVFINGATPTAYNKATGVTATVVDANTFTYPLTSAPGANTSTTVTAQIKTTTARATSVNHGLLDGSSVTIAGASPGAFNGPFTITRVDANTFTYVIASAQGDATGTITADQAAGASPERDAIINWVRGQDNLQDENINGSLTDIRASVHGDVLHSRPAVVNYNRFSGSDDDVFVYYGGNDGVFHALKGGYAVPTGDTSGLTPGQEAWGFVPSEFFGSFKRLRNNSPIISSAFKRPYFMDGPIGVLTQDNTVPPNGKLGDVQGTPTALVQPTSDVVNLYISNRRGGRFLYALDVNVPTAPKFLWKIAHTTAGFGELGQTWSQPTVVSGLAGLTTPVVMFGAGYDPDVEDLDPATISSVNTTTGAVTLTSGSSISRSMGRGIFVVNATTGALIWKAGAPGSGATLEVPGMIYAIPSDISVIRNESGGPTNRAYVGDTGGNLWRIDFKSDTSATQPNLALTTVTKLASVADQSAAAGRRKFLFPPDIVGQQGYDAVLIGSGDREHPFDTAITNRFYMFKDKGGDAGAVTGTTACDPTITEGAIADAADACTPNPGPIAGLSDLTSNCIQDAASCAGGETQAAVSAKLGTDRGWFITLGAGEKVVGNAISISGTTFFNTNQPSATAGGGTCGSNLGIARQYQVATVDATATSDLNAVGGLTAADRSLIHAGGGYLPSPVHVVVKLGGKPVEAVISGIQVSTPPGATLSARLRKYWYKEIDPK